MHCYAVAVCREQSGFKLFHTYVICESHSHDAMLSPVGLLC